MLLDFLIILVFVFIVAALVMALGTRPIAISPAGIQPLENNMIESNHGYGDFEELAGMMQNDPNLLKSSPPVSIPRANLPGALLGGGAADESCSKSVATIAIALDEDPSERRKYNRRLSDRRTLHQVVDEERRLIQRRVWLRREEDRKGKVLLNITDAAHTLGVSIETLYKWLDSSDIPFYQVTEGKRKAIRFEVNELLHWHSQYTRRSHDRGHKT
jgi:excisionase family DNA binding protein